MLTKIVNWQTEDGVRFSTREDAEHHQETFDRLDLIRDNLDVDGGTVSAEAVLEFIKKYAIWKE